MGGLQDGLDGSARVREVELVQARAVDQLHPVVAQVARRACAVYLHYVWVVELRDDACLAREALAPCLLAAAGRGEDLDGDLAVEGNLERFPDCAHAAAADLPLERVVAVGKDRRHVRGAAVPQPALAAVVFHLHEEGQQVLQLVGLLRMGGDERLLVRHVAAAELLEEILDQPLCRRFLFHGLNSEYSPRTFLRRLSART